VGKKREEDKAENLQQQRKRREFHHITRPFLSLLGVEEEDDKKPAEEGVSKGSRRNHQHEIGRPQLHKLIRKAKSQIKLDNFEVKVAQVCEMILEL
jgi:hypothetical protein